MSDGQTMQEAWYESFGARFPLAEIARANERVEQGGSPGCVLLRIPD